MRSIRKKLFLLLIIMGALPLFIVLSVSSFFMMDEAEQELFRESHLRNSIVSEHITELCEKNFFVLRSLSMNPLIKQFVSNPSAVPHLQLSTLLHNTNNIFNDSNIMAITGANAIQLFRTDGSELVNVATRRHFKEAMKGREFVSDIIVSMSTGEMIIVLEVPIKNDKSQPIGMLQRNFNLIDIQNFTKSLDDKYNSIVIVDREGRIIADSDKVFSSATEYIDDGSYTLISQRIKDDSNPFGILHMEINGEDSLVSYSSNYITGWFIFVVQPYHFIWEKILIKFLSAVALGIFLLILVSILANKLAYKATKPIIDITHAADKISRGNNSVELLEFKSDDEVGQMADAFNRLRTLRDSYQLQAEVDRLTKLYNKTTTENICKLKLKDWNSSSSSLPDSLMAFYIIDLDHFKEVNDTLGHQFGDKVLVEFSNRLRKIFRPNDCVGRFGGDEFIVIIDNLPSTEIIVRKAENIKRIACDLTVDGKNVGISASIGISIVPPQGTNYDILFKSADEALYQVKASGRNGYRINYAEPIHN